MSKISCFNCDSGIHNHCDGCNLYNISKEFYRPEIYEKELEIYKKALKMACKENMRWWDDGDDLMDSYLEEARREV